MAAAQGTVVAFWAPPLPPPAAAGGAGSSMCSWNIAKKRDLGQAFRWWVFVKWDQNPSFIEGEGIRYVQFSSTCLIVYKEYEP